MDEIIKNWLALHKTDYAVLGRDSGTVRRAAQLLAYTGQRYVPVKKDDSHTAFYWLTDKNLLITKPVQTPNGMIRAGLNYADLRLCIMEDHDIAHQTGLQGITMQVANDWLADHLREHGLDTAGFDSR